MSQHTSATLRIYWQHVKRYPWVTGIALAAIILATSEGVVLPLLFKKFFDTLANAGFDRNSVAQQLLHALLAIGALELFGWAMYRVATFASIIVQGKVMFDVSTMSFATLHRHAVSFFANNFVGSLVKKVKWFSRAFEKVSDDIFWRIIPMIVSLVAITAVLFQRNATLGLVIFIWLVIFLGAQVFFIRYKLKYDLARSAAETKSTAILADSITNYSTITLFGGFLREVRRFSRAMDNQRRLYMLSWNISGIFDSVQGFLMICLEIGGFILVIHLWKQGTLTLGDFVLFQSYVLVLFNRLWDFGRVARDVYESLADADEMTVVLQTPLEVTDVATAKPLVVSSGAVRFSTVDFNYRRTRRVLHGFSLDIAPGEHVALVGPSGAGKSTVVKILLRLHDVSGGTITIDGQDVSKVTQESLRQNISLVPQDPVLFHRSLMENIRYGKPEATDQEVIAAATAAHCHEFIQTFPEQYNTFVGERGVKLSGGERQRVAIARAMLANTPILVLDEATSSLDSESEQLVQAALAKLMAGKTVLAIAHRLSTIRAMDRIVVMDNGRITETGTHDQLLAMELSLYGKLWNLQVAGTGVLPQVAEEDEA
ncbi:MAG: ABC transporter ATP-binding protein [Patescibacteria group bacterium]|jgi:ATP-binding cassette subfamily B protein